MNNLHRRLSILFAYFILQILAVAGQNPPEQTLVLNQSIGSEIKGGEKQIYAVQVGANQTARVEIIQKGIDVSLAAMKPSGEIFIESESPSGLAGDDLILLTAKDAGEYKIAVSPADPRAAMGKYSIRLAEIRPTMTQDFEINEASKKITEAANETTALRQKGTREGRRQALEKFQEVVRLSKIKQDKTWEIVALISSGVVYEQLGEIQNALDAYLHGLKLTRELGNKQYEGTALNNIAVCYNTIAEYETGISYLNQALSLHLAAGSKRDLANDYSNLGTVYMLLGDFRKSEGFYVQSLALRREIKDQRGESAVLNNLGVMFSMSDDIPKATDFLQQALTLRRSIGERQGEAVTLRNLGRDLWKTGEAAKAEEHFRQANTLAQQVGDRRVEAETFYWLALTETGRENFPAAIENIEKGLAIIEKIRGEIINPQLRASYFSTVQQFYDLYAELLAARYAKSKDEADARLALEISQRARSRSLIELLQEARVNVKQSDNAETLERIEDLQDTLNARYRQKTLLSSGANTAAQTARLTTEINSLNTELENLQTKIFRENPRYADLTQGAPLTAQEIQKLLDDETVLLEYKLGEKRSFLWLVTHNDLKFYTLPPRREIETAAKAFYDSIISRDKAKELETAELANRLNNILLAPVADKIGNRRTAIVADGVLQYIPFSRLLVSDSEPPAANSARGDLKNEIVILPSAGVLAELRRTAAKIQTPNKTLAIFADAVFDHKDTRLSTVAKNVRAEDEKTPEIKLALRDFGAGDNLPRLLSSRLEARNISAFAPKDQIVVNLDFEASRENAISANLADYRIVHFATHGLLDTSRPELSGLVLSLYDKNGAAKNGFLRLNHIYNLNLNSDLVVLSACQTALGKDVRGEGLIGLTRGFMYAGAKRVVASLWKVDDAATAEFMKRFYQNLLQKNQKPSAALRSTQNEMKAILRFRNPYFWAGFTMQGDWK